MEEQEKKPLLEALLFCSSEPITATALKGISGIPEAEIRQLMDSLISDYDNHDGGFRIAEIANGYQFVANPKYSSWTRKLKTSEASQKLSLPSLETLAIIAYKQPIIKAEIEQVRGANSDGVIKTLLDRRLIRILGRKEAPGKPILYGTTRDFLEYFGLKDLAELPTLKDIAREEVI